MKYQKPDGTIEFGLSGCCCPPGQRRKGQHTNSSTRWWRINDGDWQILDTVGNPITYAQGAKSCEQFKVMIGAGTNQPQSDMKTEDKINPASSDAREADLLRQRDNAFADNDALRAHNVELADKLETALEFLASNTDKFNELHAELNEFGIAESGSVLDRVSELADRCDAAETFNRNIIRSLCLPEKSTSFDVVKTVQAERRKIIFLTVELAKHHDKAHQQDPELEHCDVCKVLDCPPL